jgi:hypothetical protein
LPGDHVEATDHAAGHVGLDVVGDATADHHGGAGHQRGGGELVVAVGTSPRPAFIDLAVVAEVFAELAGVGVHRDQARVDGVGQQAALALAPAGTLAAMIGELFGWVGWAIGAVASK